MFTTSVKQFGFSAAPAHAGVPRTRFVYKKTGFLKCTQKDKSKKPDNITNRGIGHGQRRGKNRSTDTLSKSSTQRNSHNVGIHLRSHVVLLSAQKNALPKKRQDGHAASRYLLSLEVYHGFSPVSIGITPDRCTF